MDIMLGLSAVSTALKITKDLRDLDVSLNNAELKAKFAELYVSLADAKMSLSEAKIHLQEKEFKISKLESQIEELTNGERCPKCLTGNLKLTDEIERRNSVARSGGLKDRKYTCQNTECQFVDSRVHDPHGLLARM